MEPKITDYSMFSAFLADICRYNRTKNRRFSYRWLARRAGIKSHSLLIMIARGQRQPTPATLAKICRALKLSEEETAYAEKLAKNTQGVPSHEVHRYESHCCFP